MIDFEGLTLEIKAEILRVVDSCGGAPDPKEPEWSKGYNDALDAVEQELKRYFARLEAAPGTN